MLEFNPLWLILDSTKIKEYQACPRRYLFERILGWSPEDPNVDLVHGSAWHKAMKFLLRNRPYVNTENIYQAACLYDLEYRQSFPDRSTDNERDPKSPNTVAQALVGYANEYDEADKNEKVLYAEIGGTVMLSEGGELIHFKMDSVVQDKEGFYFSREHKTGSRLDEKWKMRWVLSTQIGTYLHVLFCLYPAEQVKGVEVSGTFWHRKGPHIYFRHLERRRLEAMEAWRINTLSWVKAVQRDTELLTSVNSEKMDVLDTFRQNPETCTQYFGCAFHSYCAAWANPLRHCDEPPLGFKVEHWDPRSEDVEKKVAV